MNNQIIKYKNALIILLMLFLISAFLAVIFYQRSKKLQPDFLKSDKIRTVKLTQQQALLAELEKRILLPKGNPFIFNVSDLPQLTSQDFFNGSKPSDKLIIFEQDQKAIIYDPADHKIVNVGPFIIQQTTPETDTTTDNRKKIYENLDFPFNATQSSH